MSEEAMKTMSETRLTEGPLHHLDGKLAECGWATSLLRAYDRDRIKRRSAASKNGTTTW